MFVRFSKGHSNKHYFVESGRNSLSVYTARFLNISNPLQLNFQLLLPLCIKTHNTVRSVKKKLETKDSMSITKSFFFLAVT